MSLKVGTTASPLILSQSHIRFQERVRKSPLLDSVWVNNPGNPQEIVLIDPKTGRPRSQSQGPMRLRKGFATSSLRTDPPCSLPKAVAFEGPVRAVFVEFPGGRQLAYHVSGQKLTVPAPTPLVITQAEAETLGLLQKDTTDLAQHFMSRTDDGADDAQAVRAMLWPLFERLSEAAIGFEKIVNQGFSNTVAEIPLRLAGFIEGAATSDADLRRAVQDDLRPPVRLLTRSGQERLIQFLELIREHGIDPEHIFVGHPTRGEVAVKIMPKGATPHKYSPLLTDAATLNGATVALTYRDTEQIISISQWARGFQSKHRPSQDELDNWLLEPPRVMGLVLANLLAAWVNVPALFLGASARHDNIIAIVADVGTQLIGKKYATAVAGRLLPPTALRTARQKAGLPMTPQTQMETAAVEIITVELEEFFERLNVEMRKLLGADEKEKS